MSDMKSWAEKEVELACAREREENGTEEGEWDYGCACYESALKAFKSLMGDGHSGFSIGLTKQILNRLIDGRPLTPIEDTPDIWNDVTWASDEEKEYQCKRMGSLFKHVHDDGSITYSDTERYYCVDINSHGTYRGGIVSEIIDEMFPITMPYYPGDPMKFYCEDFLTDKKNGGFDTVSVFYAIKSNGEKIEINRFFKEGPDDWIEISKEEYLERKLLKI